MAGPGSGIDVVIAKLGARYPARRLLVFAVLDACLGVALFELDGTEQAWATWLVNFERDPYTFGGIYFRPENGGVDAAFKDFAQRMRSTAHRRDTPVGQWIPRTE